MRLRAVMAEHLRRITQRYGNAINRWIAVNEPLRFVGNTSQDQDNHFSRVLGPDWIADSFRIARRAAPHASLWLNEDFTEFDGRKAAALVALTRRLLLEHAPVDGFGLQGHLFSPVPLQPAAPDHGLVLRTLRALARLGVQVALTEIDAPTPPSTPDRFSVQAARMLALVQDCLAVRRCTSITFWDLKDSESWLSGLFRRNDLAPTLFAAAGGPHPAFAAVRSALLARRC